MQTPKKIYWVIVAFIALTVITISGTIAILQMVKTHEEQQYNRCIEELGGGDAAYCTCNKIIYESNECY